jgi:hypothetical protein
MSKNLYYIRATNNQGCSTSGNNGFPVTSLITACSFARSEFGSGWKIEIEKFGIDGDGKSIMYPSDIVKSFTIR